MLKINRTNPLVLTLSLATIFSSTISLAYNSTQSTSLNSALFVDSTISIEQVTKDVTFLASDKLKGRDNFSTDIKIAAKFIGTRFNEIGLKSLSDTDNYQQSYRVEKITPTNISAIINNIEIATEQLAMVTNKTELSWLSVNTNEQIISHIVAKEDNMRDELQAINHQGGQHLVILHSSHEETFKRYQNYFGRGITKLVEGNLLEGNNNKKPASIVLVLSDIDKITSFDVKGTTLAIQTKLTNVIGILPGKSKANEIVLYTAHYDHLGEQTSNNEIFNGADDDASGVSAIINLANHFAKTDNNERTLMFAAFSAEEIGGFGSRYFSKQLEPNSITAMINIEMIGKPAKFGAGTVWMTGMERSNLGEQLNLALNKQALDKQALTIYADPYPEQNLFYRSDNATLARLGVPAHSFSSTQLDKDQHYHQVTDDIDSLDLNSMLKVIKTLAIATTPLITGEITPSRIDPNLVKSTGLIY